MYPYIKYKSLMSVGQICDEGYAAVFTKDKAHIVKTDDVTITGPVHVSGTRDTSTDMLWVTDIAHTTKSDNTMVPSNNANNVHKMRSIPDLVAYHHQSCWCPTTRTWIKAINRGHFVTFPGSTRQAVRKHLRPSIATAKGHMTK